MNDSVSSANDIVNKMQGMSCSQFNPKMPGAGLMNELSQHFNDLQNKLQNSNPFGNEIVAIQNTKPGSAEYNRCVQDLQNKVQEANNNPAVQKAANFSPSQMMANSESKIAAERAKYSLSQMAKTPQMPNTPEMPNAPQTPNAPQGPYNELTKAQQAAQEKAQIAQNAVDNIEKKIPQPPQPPQMPQNPINNVSITIPSWSLPNCPQLSGLLAQLATLKALVSATVVAELLNQAEGDAASNAADKDLVVVSGAIANCTMTMPPRAPINVTVLAGGAKAGERPIAQPANVMFSCSANCTSQANPPTAAATAAASGVPTPGPCSIAVPGAISPATWVNTTVGKKTVDGMPCLVKRSTNTCIYGGQITIINPGQTDESVPVAAPAA